jgi:type III secretion protein L
MLISRRGDWRIESDGYISSDELIELDRLRALEEARAEQAADDTARLAARVRTLKRRAWRRGYEAGRAAALREQVGPSAAASFAARCLEERLTQIAMCAIAEIVGELPTAMVLPNQLRRCIAASRSQRLMSVRVSVGDYEDAKRLVTAFEQQLGAPLVAVLADAGLPPQSCVVETEHGVIDGSLKLQLVALERGMRDAIGAVLEKYAYIDDRFARELDVVEQGLRDTLDALAFATLRPAGGLRSGDEA